MFHPSLIGIMLAVCVFICVTIYIKTQTAKEQALQAKTNNETIDNSIEDILLLMEADLLIYHTNIDEEKAEKAFISYQQHKKALHQKISSTKET